MNKHLTIAFATVALTGASAFAQNHDWKAPASASKKESPVPASASALAKGKALYAVQCAVCHGPSGRGDGAAAAALVPPPRNLMEAAIQGQSDGAIFWKLTQGRAPMPSFAGVSEEDRWSVIQYIRKLGGGSIKSGPVPKPVPDASTVPAAASAESDPTELALLPPAESETGPVSREEYNALLGRMAELEKRLVASEGQVATREASVDQSLSELATKNESVGKVADSTRPGTTKFLLSGYGVAGYEDRPGESGKFYAGFNPIFLWSLSDRLFFEGELELELTSDATDVALEYANLSYLVNDYVTAKAGKFLAPFGTFADRLHPAWINKLPDFPLGVGHGGIGPMALVGGQLSGGSNLGPTKLNYAVYAANGPLQSPHTDMPEEIGALDFNNFTETNSRSYGGRIGFLPIPELEVGYSLQLVTGPVDARLQAVDLAYTREFGGLHGTLDMRGQWIWSDAGNFSYLPEMAPRAEGAAPDAMPIAFENRRNGGYVQLAYRPTLATNHIVKNFEIVGRYDRLSLPTAVGFSDDPEHFTFGLNYWLSPSTVIRAAYQFDLSDPYLDADLNGNALLFQAAMGF